MSDLAYKQHKRSIEHVLPCMHIHKAVSRFFLEPHLEQTTADLVNVRSGRVQQTGRQPFLNMEALSLFTYYAPM